MMKLQLTLQNCFYTDEKLFELFYIENDFGNYFSKCHNSFKYIVSHIKVIP